MLRYLSAGESHGKSLIGILEGIPAGLNISDKEINIELARRQKGYGRSQRMKIESDTAEIISGVRWGETTGAPISILVRNIDFENWKTIMSQDINDKDEKFFLTRPRPGHADLPGALKFQFKDIRNIQERASARETAMRVAIGAICKKFLSQFNIKIFSVVEKIGGVVSKVDEKEIEKKYDKIENSLVRCADSIAEKKIIEIIDSAKAKGDTVGGIFKIIVKGLVPGLGSHTQWDKKLDSRIAQSVISIQAVKGVEFGLGFEFADRFGSQAHDEIFYDKTSNKFYRKTNNAGGIEGGISNGEDIVIRAVMKPIPSLKQPLKSVDIKTKEEIQAEVIRSDICAVPACAVIAEAAVAFTIAEVFLEKFNGDSIAETKANYQSYLTMLKNF